MSSGLHASGLCVDLGGRTVLHGVLFEPARRWTAVVGPNGAGKSTLLRALAGPRRASGRQRAARRPRTAGRATAPSAAGASPGCRSWPRPTGELTARETVPLGRLPHLGLFGTPGPADEAAVDAAMAVTECAARAHRRLAELSGGERQRVHAGARAGRRRAGPAARRADDPLDPPHQVALVRLPRRLAATHTVVTVLHDLPLALAAERVLLLGAGPVEAEGAATTRRCTPP